MHRFSARTQACRPGGGQSGSRVNAAVPISLLSSSLTRNLLLRQRLRVVLLGGQDLRAGWGRGGEVVDLGPGNAIQSRTCRAVWSRLRQRSQDCEAGCTEVLQAERHECAGGTRHCTAAQPAAPHLCLDGLVAGALLPCRLLALRQRVLVHLVRVVLLVDLSQPLDVEELEVLRR